MMDQWVGDTIQMISNEFYLVNWTMFKLYGRKAAKVCTGRELAILRSR
jgi:hypothetical protein